MQISSQGLSPTFQPLCAGRLTTPLPPSAGTVATHPCGSSFTMNRVHSHTWEVSDSHCPEYSPISWPTFYSETPDFLEHYPPLPSVSVLFLHPQSPEAVASYRLLLTITIQMRNQTQLTHQLCGLLHFSPCTSVAEFIKRWACDRAIGNSKGDSKGDSSGTDTRILVLLATYSSNTFIDRFLCQVLF